MLSLSLFFKASIYSGAWKIVAAQWSKAEIVDFFIQFIIREHDSGSIGIWMDLNKDIV